MSDEYNPYTDVLKDQNYGNEGTTYSGPDALDPVTNSPVNSGGTDWWGEAKKLYDNVTGLFTGETGGRTGQFASFAGLAALLNSMDKGDPAAPTGYQGGIPEYTASRQQYAFAPSSVSSLPQEQAALPYLQGQGRTDAQIAQQMINNGITPEYVSQIGGVPLDQMNARYNAAFGPNAQGTRRPGSGGVTYFSPMEYMGTGRDMSGINQPAAAPAAPAATANRTGTGAPVADATANRTGTGAVDPTDQESWWTSLNGLQSHALRAGYVSADGTISPNGYEHFYRDAKAKGVSADQIDRAFGLPAGTTAQWVQGQGLDSFGAGQHQFAAGGIATPRFVQGPGDGTSDGIKALLNGNEQAALADGEFVVDARTVSELGNGSSKAGAQKLYAMMDRVHKARKTAALGKPSAADKYLPA